MPETNLQPAYLNKETHKVIDVMPTRLIERMLHEGAGEEEMLTEVESLALLDENREQFYDKNDNCITRHPNHRSLQKACNSTPGAAPR